MLGVLIVIIMTKLKVTYPQTKLQPPTVNPPLNKANPEYQSALEKGWETSANLPEKIMDKIIP